MGSNCRQLKNSEMRPVGRPLAYIMGRPCDSRLFSCIFGIVYLE